MLLGELPHLNDATALRKMPSEGTAALPEPAPVDGSSFAVHLFPELRDWVPVLSQLPVSAGDAAYLAALASSNGTDFQTELLASGSVAVIAT